VEVYLVRHGTVVFSLQILLKIFLLIKGKVKGKVVSLLELSTTP